MKKKKIPEIYRRSNMNRLPNTKNINLLHILREQKALLNLLINLHRRFILTSIFANRIFYKKKLLIENRSSIFLEAPKIIEIRKSTKIAEFIEDYSYFR